MGRSGRLGKGSNQLLIRIPKLGGLSRLAVRSERRPDCKPHKRTALLWAKEATSLLEAASQSLVMATVSVPPSGSSRILAKRAE